VVQLEQRDKPNRMLRIELNPQLTEAERAAIVRYLIQHGRLSAQEWLVALRAFDLLGDSTVTVGEQREAFCAIYARLVEQKHADNFIEQLLALEDIKVESERLKASVARTIAQELADAGLYRRDITRLYDAHQRRYRIAVIMTEAAWRDVNGDTVSAPLEGATDLFPQPVRVKYVEGPLIAVDYHVWKQRVKTRQREA
jgi:hypothetical protein